jgi:hypothetical protein
LRIIGEHRGVARAKDTQGLALDAAALWVAIKGVRVGGIRLGNAFHHLRLAIEPKQIAHTFFRRIGHTVRKNKSKHKILKQSKNIK